MIGSVLICLSTSGDFKGRVVRWATDSCVNHSFLMYQSPQWSGWWATQIDNKYGVVNVPADRVPYEHIECYLIKDINLEKYLPAVSKYVGRKFDWLGVIGLGIKILVYKLFRKKLNKNPLQKAGELFCSEFVATFLKIAGYGPAANVEPSEMSPKDLKEMLLSDKGTIIIANPTLER